LRKLQNTLPKFSVFGFRPSASYFTFDSWKDARSGYAKSRSLKVKNMRLTPSKGLGKALIAPLAE